MDLWKKRQGLQCNLQGLVGDNKQNNTLYSSHTPTDLGTWATCKGFAPARRENIWRESAASALRLYLAKMAGIYTVDEAGLMNRQDYCAIPSLREHAHFSSIPESTIGHMVDMFSPHVQCMPSSPATGSVPDCRTPGCSYNF